MANIQKITIPWTDGSGDKFYVSWDADSLPGTTTVSVTSDPNYTGKQREYSATFETQAPNAQPTEQVKRVLKVIQLTDSLVIATFGPNKTVGMYADMKAGYDKNK